jgi:estrone sulfotransferase
MAGHSPRTIVDPLRKLRSKGRIVLARLGLGDRRAARLGLARVFDSDVFIASFPRSGNTWVRFLIANLLHPGELISLRNIDSFVPDIHREARLADRLRPPRFLKSHLAAFECFPRFVYVYRDGRDVAVSYYFYATQREWFRGAFSAFLRDSSLLAPPLNWVAHVEGALSEARQRPERVLLLSYEEMLAEPLGQLRRLAHFFQLPDDEELLASAVAKCSFARLRAVEKSHGPEMPGARHEFFRRGEPHQWETVFSQEDLAFFTARAGDLLARLGYPV